MQQVCTERQANESSGDLDATRVTSPRYHLRRRSGSRDAGVRSIDRVDLWAAFPAQHEISCSAP
jgi:hypothetical protein